MSPDPRLTLRTSESASAAVEGVVRAARYWPTRTFGVRAPRLAIRRQPADGAEQLDELVFGELFDVLEVTDGYALGQARRDGYVGFVASDGLAERGEAPTHRLAAASSFAFDEPTIKSRARGPFFMNSLLHVDLEQGSLVHAQGAGWFPRICVAPVGASFPDDVAAEALKFLETPYLWGGRTAAGLDCSGLVQQALFACGRGCPRDSDQQAAAFAPVEERELSRGDLVFWKGHVAMLIDAERMVHANAHHMKVAIEPLSEARKRILASGGGEITGFRRP